MKETLLHHIFYQKKLGFKFKTTTGKSIEILDFGELNKDAGPDFSNVKLRFDDKIWFGPLEFHIRSSDWYKHNHQKDERYNNVIAHFVYEHDQEVHSGNYLLPTVELKEQIDAKEFLEYENLVSNSSAIKCASLLEKVDSKYITEQKDLAIKQRLKRKSQESGELIRKFGLEKAFYIQLAAQLGSKVNSLSFTKLMEQIDLNWIAKLNYDQFRIEALLFGMAGLIPENSDQKYVLNLKDEYNYIRRLLDLDNSFSTIEWKYSTMRPPNFPDIRIAQLSGLLSNARKYSISNLLEADYKDLKNSFNIDLHPFWNTHYRLENKTNSKSSKLSDGIIDLLIINTINPITYSVGIRTSNDSYNNQVLDRLKMMKAENNYITKQWIRYNVHSINALDSQALIETKNEFCNEKKCLFCAIGKSIMNK